MPGEIDLDRLSRLHASGDLTDAEFAAATAAVRGEPAGDRSVKPWLYGGSLLLVLVLALALGTTWRLGHDDQTHATPSRQASTTTLSTPTPTPTTSTSTPPTTTPSATPSATPTSATTDTSPANAEPASTGDVTVVESGWGAVLDGEFANWGAVLRNDTDKWLVTDVAVTGLDAAGEAVGSATETVILAPAETAPVAGRFLDQPHGLKKIEVEATVNFEQEPMYTGDVALSGKIRGHEYDSKIAWTLTSALDSGLRQGAPLHVVFRGKHGKIVGGAQDFLPVSVSPGKTKAFATDTSTAVPLNATAVEGWIELSGWTQVS